MATLVRRNPFDDLSLSWPRDLFARFGPSPLQAEWKPSCDISEDEQAITVHAELPGVEAKDMDVSVNQGMLTIRGEKRSQRKGDDDHGSGERFFGLFERVLSLPATVAEDKIEASLKDGVLEVRLPKTEPSPPPVARSIPIKTS